MTQTGSGKTYTMGSGWEAGPGRGSGEEAEVEERRGIIPRAICDLFAGIERRVQEARAHGLPPPEFTMKAQFIELYNEDIIDLFEPTSGLYNRVHITYYIDSLHSIPHFIISIIMKTTGLMVSVDRAGCVSKRTAAAACASRTYRVGR